MTATETALAELRQKILRMGSLAETILAKAFRVVAERNGELAAEVHENDLEIDQLDVQLDELILRALALQAPVASNLREVVAVKSVASDLERVGDLARNIAKSGARLAGREATAWSARLEPLQEAATRALRLSLDSLQRLDADGAREVIEFDDEIDLLQDRLVREMIDQIAVEPGMCHQLVDLILIAESLERVGDHATNIAEEVILVAEAVNVKHASKLGSAGEGS